MSRHRGHPRAVRPSSDSSACACPWPRPSTSETTIQANAVPTPMRASRTILGSCEVAISTFTSHDERAARSERIVREGAWTCDDTGSVSGLSRPCCARILPAEARRGRRWRCPRNCAQGTKHSPTFNPDFNHIPLHRLCNTKGQVTRRFPRELCCEKQRVLHSGCSQACRRFTQALHRVIHRPCCGCRRPSLAWGAAHSCAWLRAGHDGVMTAGAGTRGLRRGAGMLRHPATTSCTQTCVTGEPRPHVP